MSGLVEAIRLIESQAQAKLAKFAAVDEGWTSETSLMATRDGYLNLALTLLRFVVNTDEGHGWVRNEQYAWSDDVKKAMYQLPCYPNVWFVGAYLFRSHEEFLRTLRLWKPDIAESLANDPAFTEPK